MIFISHDLSVVRHIAETIAVMYLGKIVGYGPTEQLFHDPLHQYTNALISAVPIPDPAKEHARRRIILEGDPPSPMNPPSGCAFHPRCPIADDACAKTCPPLEEKSQGHRAACLKVE